MQYTSILLESLGLHVHFYQLMDTSLSAHGDTRMQTEMQWIWLDKCVELASACSDGFPDENEYDSYLISHGGGANAYTEMVRLAHSRTCAGHLRA